MLSIATFYGALRQAQGDRLPSTSALRQAQGDGVCWMENILHFGCSAIFVSHSRHLLYNKTIILTTFLLVVNTISGQSYYFRHFQVENGLSNNAVICSLQDKKGFLWFGTKDGLDRFDGYSFKIFRSDPDDSGSIGSNFIHSLYEDPKGVLWVGTEKGLYKHNATTEGFS